MKTRLTITLSESTLRQLDQLIDSTNIRNRSHAIEHILEQHLRPQVRTALILAGGPTLNTEPLRPLTILDGKPLIIHTIDHLKRFGVDTIIITTTKAGRDIQTLLGTGREFGVTIEYFFEEKPLGTAGAIKNAKSKLPKKDPFYVLAGDILTTIDLADFSEFHNQNKSLVTMAVKPRVSKSSYDNVYIQGHTVVDFQKSQPNQEVSIVNTGVYIFEPAVLNYIPDGVPAMLESDVFPQLAKQHKLVAFTFQGIWFDITSDQNYHDALKKLELKQKK